MSIQVIGLTGQTGAGKSTVSQIFAQHGFAVINADEVARSVAEPEHPCLAEVFAAFGDGVQNPDGTLNRKALAKIVFHDSSRLEQLNHIMHPHITAMIRELIADAAQTGHRFVLLDAPTLFESGADALCDCIVSVTAPAQQRLPRIMRRDGIDENAARERMNAQLSEAFFIAHSDDIIQNDGDLCALEAAAESVVCQIMTKFSV